MARTKQESVLGVQGVELNTKRIALPPKKKKNIVIPEAGEVIKLIIGTDIEFPCLLAMWFSLRVSEVRGLQFRDISPDGKTISIKRTRIYFDGDDILRDCNKTYESIRTNLLPPYIYGLIKKVPHKEPTDFIVNMSYQTINGHFRKIMEKAGYNITFHKLRHDS